MPGIFSTSFWNLPRGYRPHYVHLVVAGQRHAKRDAGGHDDHDDLPRDGNGQLLFEALVHVFDRVQEDDADKAQDQSADVGAGDVTEHGLDALEKSQNSRDSSW